MSCNFSSKLYKETDILQPRFISILQRLVVKLLASVVHKRLLKILMMVFDEIILEFQAVVALYRPLLMKTSIVLKSNCVKIEEDSHLSYQEISALTGISSPFVNRILSESLQKRSVFARWVPHTLSDANKQDRVQEACSHSSSPFSVRSSHKRTIIIDEK